MSSQAQSEQAGPLPLASYKNILLAVDSSDHANQGVVEAIHLAGLWGSSLTATHVYAAKLHDMRFRQMEGGLPEQFREEEELQRQRDVHDDLITRGLSIITDSYLDQVEIESQGKGISLQRRSLEGKNYRELVRESNRGDYDLLVLGALGLGAIKGSRLGSVCQRVARRSDIDTLVIKEPQRPISDGPIVVAVDGSAKSYGGLRTALSLAKEWHVPVKVVSAFDPYYHYVAFNRIAGVLSQEAGKVFRFQEQEKLHEEIIDSGLAKIYQGHLEVARQIAADHDMAVETKLLDGKPHDVIDRYLKLEKPSLLIIGKLGIHADEELDIGGNAEALLNACDCAVLLSQQEYRPPLDSLAEVTTSWTREAQARMDRVPSFVRNMARMAILRYAQEHDHSLITASLVEEATAQLMPGYAEQAMQEIVSAYDSGELRHKPSADEAMGWSDEATQLLFSVQDPSLRDNLSLRAQKKARASGARLVEAGHIAPFLDHDNMAEVAPGGSAPPQETPQDTPSAYHWQAAALARLMRVPAGFMRESSKQRIETYAAANGLNEISLDIAEAGLAEARTAMAHSMASGQEPALPGDDKHSACPFAGLTKTQEKTSQPINNAPAWTAGAKAMVQGVPVGFCQEMTVKAAESIAAHNGVDLVDEGFVTQVLDTIKTASDAVETTLPWEEAAAARLAPIPEFVRGMLVREIEAWARRNDSAMVDQQAVDAVKAEWRQRGVFHLDPADPRSRMGDGSESPNE